MSERGSKFDRERHGRELVNVGVAAEAKEGKERCQDSKINDPERGLFMVADGTSTSDGARASQTVGEYAQRYLGDDLDNGIENNLHSADLTFDERLQHVDALVKVNMIRAINESHDLLRAGDKDATTTMSLTKLVGLPTGKSRMYFANIGDSRVYVLRGRKIEKLTMDDNAITEYIGTEIAPGKPFTKEDARTVDQAKSKDELTEIQSMVKRFAGPNITKALGSKRRENADLGFVMKADPNDSSQREVQHIDLDSGDRILITSDGVHDQLLESEIEAIMLANKESALQAEKALQAKSKEMALGGKRLNPRSKNDDIAAVVHEVGLQSGGENGRGKKKEKILKSDVEAWVRKAGSLFKEMKALKRVHDQARERSADDVFMIGKRRELNHAQKEWARYDHAIKKYEYDQAVLQYDSDSQHQFDHDQMAMIKAKKDNAARRYEAYAREGEKLDGQYEEMLRNQTMAMAA